MLKKIIRYIIISNYQKINKVLYFLLKYFYIKNAMNHLNLNDITIFNYSKWHHGFCYFSATFNGKKVFVKIDTKLQILENEVFFYNYMENEIQHYLIIKYDFYKNKNLELVIFEFLEEVQELNKEILLSNLNYLDDIFLILKSIEAKKLIHRDIKLDNFMIVNNNLKIIDFTFANSFLDYTEFIELNIKEKKNFMILKALGRGFKPKDFVWNDFISMSIIIEELLSEKIKSKDQDILKMYLEKFKKQSFNASYTKISNLLND